ncbi:MAG TPA: Rv1535 family protein [Mycobacterium sp.]|nr:Rv1535 family protein [Mycobacterium sp.]
MAAVAYTEAITPTQAAATSLAALHRREMTSDPLVDGATRLLSIPLRQVYALAWRTGILTIK